MVRFTAELVPCPISVMAMTAATPMMMPRAVSAERMMLRRRAVRAILKVRKKNRMDLKSTTDYADDTDKETHPRLLHDLWFILLCLCNNPETTIREISVIRGSFILHDDTA